MILKKNTISIDTLWLGMARIEMDCNLKKLAKFFKFFLCIVEKSPKNLMIVCSSQEKSLNDIFLVL